MALGREDATPTLTPPATLQAFTFNFNWPEALECCVRVRWGAGISGAGSNRAHQGQEVL